MSSNMRKFGVNGYESYLSDWVTLFLCIILIFYTQLYVF
jgi:hypothetical protein